MVKCQIFSPRVVGSSPCMGRLYSLWQIYVLHVSSRKELISTGIDTKVQEVLSVQFRKYFLYYSVYNRLNKHLNSASASCSDNWIYIDLVNKW